jgi:hypothetical protein
VITGKSADALRRRIRTISGAMSVPVGFDALGAQHFAFMVLQVGLCDFHSALRAFGHLGDGS